MVQEQGAEDGALPSSEDTVPSEAPAFFVSAMPPEPGHMPVSLAENTQGVRAAGWAPGSVSPWLAFTPPERTSGLRSRLRVWKQNRKRHHAGREEPGPEVLLRVACLHALGASGTWGHDGNGFSCAHGSAGAASCVKGPVKHVR